MDLILGMGVIVVIQIKCITISAYITIHIVLILKVMTIILNKLSKKNQMVEMCVLILI